jgi:hypothetical protein
LVISFGYLLAHPAWKKKNPFLTISARIFFSLISIMMSSQIEHMGGNILVSVVALQSSIFQKIHHAFVLNLEVVHELT